MSANGFACAGASARRDESMWATASRVRQWLLVETRGAWGRDAVADSELGPHAPAAWREAMKARGIRVVAIRRDLDMHHDTSGGVRLVHVVAGRPSAVQARASRLIIDSARELVAATAPLLTPAGSEDGWVEDHDRYVLVCTNGRHDPCCATLGRPLARALRESCWASRTWECSHIGGDRFAGNLVLLPESLYFGRCDAAAAVRVLQAYDAGRLDVTYFRGRSSLSLAEQAAEHFVRTELGLDSVDAVASIETLDAGRVRILAETTGHRRALAVTVRRSTTPAPTPLTCRGALGLGYPTFTLVGIEPDE